MIKSLNAHLVVLSEHNVLCALEGWRSWQKSVWGDARCLIRVRRTRSGTPHHVSFRNTSLLFSDRNRKARREASLTASLSGSVSGSVWEPAELVGGAGGDHRAAGGSAGAAAQVRQSSYHIILFWALLVCLRVCSTSLCSHNRLSISSEPSRLSPAFSCLKVLSLNSCALTWTQVRFMCLYVVLLCAYSLIISCLVHTYTPLVKSLE